MVDSCLKEICASCSVYYILSYTSLFLHFLHLHCLVYTCLTCYVKLVASGVVTFSLSPDYCYCNLYVYICIFDFGGGRKPPSGRQQPSHMIQPRYWLSCFFLCAQSNFNYGRRFLSPKHPKYPLGN